MFWLAPSTYHLTPLSPQSVPAQFANINNVRYANAFAGADAGEKIAACVADLPVDGGTCEARGLQGEQSAADTLTVSKSVILLIDNVTLTMAGSPRIHSTAPFSILGTNPYISVLQFSSGTAIWIKHESDSALNLRDLYLASTGTPTGGAAVTLDGTTPSTTVNHHSNLSNVIISNPWIGMHAISADGWLLTNGTAINGTQLYSVEIENVSNPDGGDNAIIGCIFGGSSVAGSSGIYHTSAGGLRIVGNKFFGYQDYAYHMNLASGASTGQLEVVANQFEAQGKGAVRIEGQSGAGGWSSIQIVANHFGADPISSISIPTSNGMYSPVSISGNTFTMAASPATPIGIDIGSSAAVLAISGNTFQGDGVVGTGIKLGAGIGGNIVVASNAMTSVLAPYNFYSSLRVDGPLYNPNAGTTSVAFANVPLARLSENIVMPNGTYLGGVQADGATTQKLIGLDGSNILQIGPASSLVNVTNWLKATRFASAINTVTFSATPTFDASLGNTQKIVLTGDVTSSTLSNATTGEQIDFIICQDSGGSHAFVWPTNVKGAMTIGATLSTCSAQSFRFDGTNAYALSAGVTNQ